MKRLFWLLLLAVSLLFARHSSATPPSAGNDNPTGVTGEYNGSTTTGGSYDPYTGNAKRFIDDLTVTGSIGEYPLKWTRTFNSRGGSGKFGDGGGWTHNYQYNLTLKSVPGLCGMQCICDGPDGVVSYPDGRRMNLNWEATPPRYVQADGFEPMGDRVVHVDGSSGNWYDLLLKDGGRVEFRPAAGIPAGAPVAIVDPYGQRTTLEYTGGQFSQLQKVTEPGGRFLLIVPETRWYQSWSNLTLQIRKDVISGVEAYDGRGHMMEKVAYSYLDVPGQAGFNTGRFVNLIGAAYDDGTHAYYDYDPPKAVLHGNAWSLAAGTLKTCNDVRFAGPMSKIEYEYVPNNQGEANAQIRGQIKAEKNIATQQRVSMLDWEDGIYHRKEVRPDGANREFWYGGFDGLREYTNFTYPGQPVQHTTIDFIDSANNNPDHYFRAVTVQNVTVIGDYFATTTWTEKEKKIGAVMSVTYHDGSKVEFTYSEPEPYYLATRKDENGKVTQYTRYPAGHQNANMIQRIDYPDHGFEEFAYNSKGQVIYHLMTSGGTEAFEYDTRGLKTTYTAPITPSDPTPGDHKTRYYYYGGPSGPGEAPQSTDVPGYLLDRLQRVIDPLGNSAWYEYNARGLVTKIIYHDNSFIQNEYYPDGTLHWTEDELHHRTTYTRDEYRRVTEVKNARNETVTNSYASPRVSNDANGFSHTTSSIYLTTSQMGVQTKFDYDAHFRRTMTQQAPEKPEVATTNFTYDWMGNLIRIEDPRHKFTAFGYDARNRRTSTRNEELNETTTVLYDPAGNK